jgi:hypothetical protein
MLRYLRLMAVVDKLMVVCLLVYPTPHNRQPPTNLLRWLLRRGSPLPIPNRVVKPACADGTAICGRVCRRLFLLNPNLFRLGFFFLLEQPVHSSLRQFDSLGWIRCVVFFVVLKSVQRGFVFTNCI